MAGPRCVPRMSPTSFCLAANAQVVKAGLLPMPGIGVGLAEPERVVRGHVPAGQRRELRGALRLVLFDARCDARDLVAGAILGLLIDRHRPELVANLFERAVARRPAFQHLDDVVAKFFRADRIADRVQRHREGRRIERLDRRSLIDPTHVAALPCRRRIARALFGQLREIAAGAELLDDAVRLRLRGCIDRRRSALIDLDQDVEDVRPLGRLELFVPLVVNLAQLGVGRIDLGAKRA